LPEVVRQGRLLELAYFADNDGSPQPYFLYVPEACRDGRPQPLTVFLHGYVPETSRTDPYLVADAILDMADEFKTVFAIPHGRTNTDFQFAGEVDVLRVIAEVGAFNPIAPDRVCLLGVSMGGAGVWQVGTHHPDRFAGIAPINGQADWFRFWHVNYGHPARAELPKHLEYMIGINNPVDLAGNLSNLYSYSQHATRCFLGPVHTREMVAKLAAVGAPHETFEDPSELGHYIYWRPECWRRAFEHLAGKIRNPRPRHVRYTTYSLRHAGAYWAAIEAIETWGAPASFEARCEDGGRIALTTTNAAALSLCPPPEWAGPDGTFAVTWNGAAARTLKPGADGKILLDDRQAAPAGVVRKTRQLCGPAADVFNFPFVVVRGTAGTEAENAVNADLAARFAEDWRLYAEGEARILADHEVTDAVIRDYGLVLVGLPESNTVLGRIAGRLPLRLSRERIELPDGKSFPTAGHGLLMTCPNPLRPDRYVLVYAGLPWGESCGRNHKFDRIPDYIVFARDPLPTMETNRFLAAGLFDGNWRYDPTLADFATAPPAPPAVPDPAVRP